MNPSNAKLISYGISGVIIVLVLIWRMRGLQRGRRLRLEWLWVVPALLGLGAAASLAQAPPVGAEWFWMGLALGLGGVFGWYRGRMMQITVDAETHTLNTRASPAALIFLVALLLVRFGLRAALESESANWGLKVALISDGFILFALGLLGVQRLEMALRARRMLASMQGAA